MNFTPTQKVLLQDVRVAIQDAGIDPEKVARIPIFPGMLKMHISGQWTRQQFQENCQKLGILNPSVRLERMQA